MSSRIDHRTPKNQKPLYVYLRKYTGRVVLALVPQKGLYDAMWRQQIGERRGLDAGVLRISSVAALSSS